MERRKGGSRDDNGVERVSPRATTGNWEECRHDTHRYFRRLFKAGDARPRPLVTDSLKLLISLRLEAP